VSDDIVNNLKEPSHWLRILFMLGFAVVLYVVGLVVLVLTLAQILFSLLTGKDNLNLRSLGSSLSRYIFEILMFLTYNSETRPFPFSPFPVMEPVAPVEPAESFEPAAPESAVDLYADEAAARAAVTEPDLSQPGPVEPFTAESDSIMPDTEVSDAGEVDSNAATEKKPGH